MNTIQLGIGFATGRRGFRKVLTAYMKNWAEAKKNLPADYEVCLNLFVAYDTDYKNTQSTDYTNLQQDIVDQFDRITFLGSKNLLRSLERLERSEHFSKTELRSVFGSGYAGKRNAILFAALENHMDYLLFLDDDEYPLAVTKTRDVCLWSGQHVLLSHLLEIPDADYTNGYHCGYISPIPQLNFTDHFKENDFRMFIEAISNDIINWDTIRDLMQSGGVTYASTDVLKAQQSHEVPEVDHCKFISGANLCINLSDPYRTFPFFNPPGARGEDAFLSTMLHERTVKRIPCYAFHDGFSIYKHILSGVLPVKLAPITTESQAIVNRFLAACVGWVRYKPLLLYITQPDSYAEKIARMQETLDDVLPKLAEYFGDDSFLSIATELEKFKRNVPKHYSQFQLARKTWVKMIDLVAEGPRQSVNE